ncbi:hypothetical protein BLNAU_6437 [Blattamonas nauphoetae]|uniref:Uncharacterized protein n=1 Tax=Blattamonas nauphoetae TaxID=2049346 RepID=A0ABQ9Y4J7_9EUKA|nr:hypothetical protein BLNAU_6437 [Blattamonas nauphoetae]
MFVVKTKRASHFVTCDGPKMERAILLNREIRNYLSQFSDPSWERVLRSTLLYGIRNVRDQYGVNVSPDQLDDLVVHQNQPNTNDPTLNIELIHLHLNLPLTRGHGCHLQHRPATQIDSFLGLFRHHLLAQPRKQDRHNLGSNQGPFPHHPHNPAADYAQTTSYQPFSNRPTSDLTNPATHHPPIRQTRPKSNISREEEQARIAYEEWTKLRDEALREEARRKKERKSKRSHSSGQSHRSEEGSHHQSEHISTHQSQSHSQHTPQSQPPRQTRSPQQPDQTSRQSSKSAVSTPQPKTPASGRSSRQSEYQSHMSQIDTPVKQQPASPSIRQGSYQTPASSRSRPASEHTSHTERTTPTRHTPRQSSVKQESVIRDLVEYDRQSVHEKTRRSSRQKDTPSKQETRSERSSHTSSTHSTPSSSHRPHMDQTPTALNRTPNDHHSSHTLSLTSTSRTERSRDSTATPTSTKHASDSKVTPTRTPPVSASHTPPASASRTPPASTPLSPPTDHSELAEQTLPRTQPPQDTPKSSSVSPHTPHTEKKQTPHRVRFGDFPTPQTRESPIAEQPLPDVHVTGSEPIPLWDSPIPPSAKPSPHTTPARQYASSASSARPPRSPAATRDTPVSCRSTRSEHSLKEQPLPQPKQGPEDSIHHESLDPSTIYPADSTFPNAGSVAPSTFLAQTPPTRHARDDTPSMLQSQRLSPTPKLDDSLRQTRISDGFQTHSISYSNGKIADSNDLSQSQLSDTISPLPSSSIPEQSTQSPSSIHQSQTHSDTTNFVTNTSTFNLSSFQKDRAPDHRDYTSSSVLERSATTSTHQYSQPSSAFRSSLVSDSPPRKDEMNSSLIDSDQSNSELTFSDIYRSIRPTEVSPSHRATSSIEDSILEPARSSQYSTHSQRSKGEADSHSHTSSRRSSHSSSPNDPSPTDPRTPPNRSSQQQSTLADLSPEISPLRSSPLDSTRTPLSLSQVSSSHHRSNHTPSVQTDLREHQSSSYLRAVGDTDSSLYDQSIQTPSRTGMDINATLSEPSSLTGTPFPRSGKETPREKPQFNREEWQKLRDESQELMKEVSEAIYNSSGT